MMLDAVTVTTLFFLTCFQDGTDIKLNNGPVDISVNILSDSQGLVGVTLVISIHKKC